MPTMYDSETPSAIPADAEIVAGYVDGQWPTFVELYKTHPNAKEFVTITVEGAAGARVGDLEVPNFHGTTIEEVAANGAAWAKSEIAGGRRPTLYYSRGNAAAVGEALAAAGVALGDVDFWVADWTGAAHLVPGAAATQWASPSTGSGGNYDISETDGAWPGVSEPPASGPPAGEPAPAPPTEGTITVNVSELKAGSSGSEVKTVQSILNGKAHAGLAVDGAFGPKTEEAVKAWQVFFHLAVDGIVGPQTWSTLVGG